MVIREIRVGDIDAFCALALQLGYEADHGHLSSCIAARDGSQRVFVAEADEGIFGWVDCRIGYTYLTPLYCEIVGLVVDEGVRGRGIGASLVARAEAWALEHGAKKAIVRSNVKRERAHKFYLDKGYAQKKQSMVFEKKLEP